MARSIVRFASPLRAAHVEIVRVLIVSGAALALICAGRPLPF